MKPGDHPEFFLRPAPDGVSRESRIRLDREGRFWHEGELVERPALTRALHRWLGRHPVDGRPILSNGYDWCYLEVDDLVAFVETVRRGEGPDAPLVLVLLDGSEHPLDPSSVSVDDDGVLHATVGSPTREARFGRHAQRELGTYLADDEPPRLVLAGRAYPIGPRAIRRRDGSES
jgi:hypothetical protein